MSCDLTAGTDYQSINLNLTFNAGVTEINVPITLLPDNFVEGNELFNTRLTIVTQGLGAMIENNMPIAPVEILDEDSKLCYVGVEGLLRCMYDYNELYSSLNKSYGILLPVIFQLLPYRRKSQLLLIQYMYMF